MKFLCVYNRKRFLIYINLTISMAAIHQEIPSSLEEAILKDDSKSGNSETIEKMAEDVPDTEENSSNGGQETVMEESTPSLQRAEEFAYLDTTGFSGEKFKIEVRGLPKFYGVQEMKKLVTMKLNLKTARIKPLKRGAKHMYMCFRDEEERQRAISALNGYFWKGQYLKAAEAAPSPDPLVVKRKQQRAAGNQEDEKSDRSQELQMKDNTTPLWEVPYEQQLESKEKTLRELLCKMAKGLSKSNEKLRPHLEEVKGAHAGQACHLEVPLKSGVRQEGYRNKCEFSVGIDKETELSTVGFRIGRYVHGSVGVGPVDKLLHVSPEMKAAVLVIQDFVRSSGLKAFNPEDHTGHWKQVMMRQSFTDNKLMMVIGLHPQDLGEEELSKFKNSLVEHLTGEQGTKCNIASVYYLKIAKKQKGDGWPVAEYLWGDTHIYDTILGYNFRISPESFFQVNTSAAEVMYSAAISLAKPTPDSTVLDVCCGTGTIGICFSKHCKQVLGLECIPEAVTDAKHNAKANGVSNAEFFCGRAECILSTVTARATQQDVIAIIDPPRAGLHMQTITQLRAQACIRRLVYMACDPEQALKNLLDLGRAPSKTLKGEPFLPTRAVAVDMFPHTKHCELILLLERPQPDAVSPGAEKPSADAPKEV